jgi:hypothetical protein
LLTTAFPDRAVKKATGAWRSFLDQALRAQSAVAG